MCKICKLNNVCYECMLCIVYMLYICVMYVLCLIWLCTWVCSVIFWCNVCFMWLYIWLCIYVFGLCGYIFGYVFMYLDPYRSFKVVLYVVCAIKERGEKVVEKCSVNRDVIYVCQL